MSKPKVAFIGLGVMGYPMAGHLANAGYQTRVYNRTTAKAEQWCRDYQGDYAQTPREAAEGADFVFMCVGNDDDLRSVVFGDDGALAGCKPGTILVDHTTASANVAREISEAAEVAFLDAPVSGGIRGRLADAVRGPPRRRLHQWPHGERHDPDVRFRVSVRRRPGR